MTSTARAAAFATEAKIIKLHTRQFQTDKSGLARRLYDTIEIFECHKLSECTSWQEVVAAFVIEDDPETGEQLVESLAMRGSTADSHPNMP